MKKQSLLKGTLILGLSGIFAKFLGLFFRWPLIMLIGDEGIGYYQMSYPLYLFFIAVASGIPVAISKMVSERKALGDNEGILQVFKKAMLLMVVIGGVFTVSILLLSRYIIDLFKWDSKAYYSLIGIATAPFFISIISAFRGFFQGLQNMNPSAVSQIIEQVGRVIFGIGLAYMLLPKGIEYAAGGAAFGATAGGILGGIYLYARYIRVRKEINVKNVRDNLDILSKLIYISVPISLGATVGSVMGLIDSILVPQKLLQGGLDFKEATILYGQLTGKASVLINVPLTISMSLCASLVPIIAECYILNRRFELMEKTQLSIKFATVISFPSCLGLFFLSEQIMQLLFPGHSGGGEILKYSSISIPFIILTQTSTAIMQGIGKYITPVVTLILGCIVKVMLTAKLVPIKGISIYGAVIGSIGGYLIVTILNMLLLKISLKIRMDWYNIFIKPLLASIIMIISVILINSRLYVIMNSSNLACVISIFSGILIYSILIFTMRIFSFGYFKNKILRHKRRGIDDKDHRTWSRF
ncbi:polysaccharide biosynthesis protein [Clostridium sp. MSJ-11]|uniref:Polysaccharide biosynthesis protein n=1 Tax=Clostridium mobile TaxID=2841512 RepID=A0ABS6EM29_9CLOT|nr:polysaccharide biosynthesis protein [Clostridium mobile]MBU5486273.1 polysaccharide biosynthesis protein [Clostridium mobile]